MSEPIQYVVRPCSLGAMLVASGPRGIAHVHLGDDPARLERTLLATEPGAELARPGSPVERWSEVLAGCLDAREKATAAAALPVDIEGGTAFQRRVWAYLRTIPEGETRSYGEVARAIGRPRAHRAVASACARNPIAWLVPCHRVVSREGFPAGYRWGSERQRQLLEAERKSRGGDGESPNSPGCGP